MSRRLLDETRLLVLPELLTPLVGAVSEGAEETADWSRNRWEAEEEVV